MFKIVGKIDALIINAVQEVYLWLLDRTGVYVATVSLVLFATGFGRALSYSMALPAFVMFLMLLLALVNLVILGSNYVQQGSGSLSYNARVLIMRDQTTIRWGVNGFLAGLLILALVEFSISEASNDLIFIIYNYTFCILIRDRNKKPFFEREARLEVNTNQA